VAGAVCWRVYLGVQASAMWCSAPLARPASVRLVVSLPMILICYSCSVCCMLGVTDMSRLEWGFTGQASAWQLCSAQAARANARRSPALPGYERVMMGWQEPASRSRSAIHTATERPNTCLQHDRACTRIAITVISLVCRCTPSLAGRALSGPFQAGRRLVSLGTPAHAARAHTHRRYVT